MIARGYDVTVFIVWSVIHTLVILTELLALGRTGFFAKGSDRSVVLQQTVTE